MVRLSCRHLTGVAVLIAVVAGAGMGAAAAGQTTTARKEGPVPRTAWGEPSLEGLWTASTSTPLERPDRFAGKQFLTEEEVAALEREARVAQVTERPVREGDPGTYNQIWFDNGTAWVKDRRTSLVIDPPDGRIPWKPGAREAIGGTLRVGPFNSPIDLDTGERCLTDGIPMVRLGYNPNHLIVQTPGYVVIRHEHFNERRIIPLTDRPHGTVRQWNGDIRGRWEGDTLVVESTNFVDKTHYRWAGAWKTPTLTKRVVERFTRVDAETIDYRLTIEDPSQFTRPWTAAIPLTTNQEARGVTAGGLYEYACHEGNYSIVNVLSGARKQEREGQTATTGAR